MNPIEKVLRGVDRTQRRTAPLAFAFAVVKKFGDDNAGALAALITYYSFLALFPMLLVLVTVVGIVAGSHQGFEHDLIHSALAQFPVIGSSTSRLSLADNIHALRRSSAVGLTVGIAGLLWGAAGAVQNGQYAMAQVWNVPQRDRPGFVARTLRSFGVLGATGVFLTVTSALSGLATVGASPAAAWRAEASVASFVVAGAFTVVIFRILTPAQIATRDLLVGALVSGGAWTVLQLLGTYLVSHELRGMSDVYGLFAVVLGALWWLYLVARVVMYAAEINVVRARRLWPRSMLQPPLTDADARMLRTYPVQEQRRPEVRVHATVDAGGGPAD